MLACLENYKYPQSSYCRVGSIQLPHGSVDHWVLPPNKSSSGVKDPVGRSFPQGRCNNSRPSTISLFMQIWFFSPSINCFPPFLGLLGFMETLGHSTVIQLHHLQDHDRSWSPPRCCEFHSCWRPCVWRCHHCLPPPSWHQLHRICTVSFLFVV